MNEGESIRVVIVDDHALFRRGLDLVLSEEPDIKVVGEAADGIEAVHRAEEMAPDVVVMDVRMPRSSGIEAARRIRERLPDTKVIMLTVSDSEEDLYAAVKGGRERLPPQGDLHRRARRRGARRRPRAQPDLAVDGSKLLTEFNALVQQAEERHRSRLPSLTDRELDVLKLVAKGLSNREISEELYISENTVKNHVRNILEKLHCTRAWKRSSTRCARSSWTWIDAVTPAPEHVRAERGEEHERQCADSDAEVVPPVGPVIQLERAAARRKPHRDEAVGRVTELH